VDEDSGQATPLLSKGFVDDIMAESLAVRRSKTILARSWAREGGRTIWVADAHRGDGKRFVVRADDKLAAFAELEPQVLTMTFYLESIQWP
jgi:hypothetical protein